MNSTSNYSNQIDQVLQSKKLWVPPTWKRLDAADSEGKPAPGPEMLDTVGS